MRWPLEDEIRWIERRLRELEKGEPCNAPLTALDCRIWLAYKRDRKSYADIARAEYKHSWDARTGKRGKNQAVISLVRRTVNRVEQYLTDPTRKWKPSEREEFARIYHALSLGAVPIYVERSSSDSTESKTSPKQRNRRKSKQR